MAWPFGETESGPVSAAARPVCLGWQFAPPASDPGPPPARPAPVQPLAVDPGWVLAQRGIARAGTRPARAGLAACCSVAAGLGAMWLTGWLAPAAAAAAMLLAAGGAAACALPCVRSGRRLAAVIAGEHDRIGATGAVQARGLASAQREQAAGYRAWQRRRAVFERQPAWFALRLPPDIDRIDVAGGTLAGWSAMLTMTASPVLDRGGEVTVLDLTEGAVACDLVSLVRRSEIAPLVWVLPGDLSVLDLGAGLSAEALADVLALAAAAAGEADRAGHAPGDRTGLEQAADSALLERVIGALGPGPLVAHVCAAIRVLADVGDPRSYVRSGLLSAEQLDQVRNLFGRGAAERIVTERAFLLQARLRGLEQLGAGQPPSAASRLRVAALDRRAGVIGNRMVGAYLVAALTHMLRQAAVREPWTHAVFVLAAERLGGDALDRLAHACETSRTGLVLAYRSVPAGVRERLGRGDAAVAFMRLGNGDDARAASELIGTEHRFVVSQLTDTVGTSLTGTWGDSYTSTAGTADSAAESFSVSRTSGGSRGRGRSRPGGFAPFGDFNRSSSQDASFSAGESGSLSLTEGVNESTAWGVSTSLAAGENSSVGLTAQRSRELLVEPGELQRLPVSAMIVCYPGPAGRQVVLTDVNPAIGALPGVADSLSCSGDSAR
jgi:hypothetical protein